MEPICPNCGGILIFSQRRAETYMLKSISLKGIHLHYIRTSQPLDAGAITCLKCNQAWSAEPAGLKILIESKKDENRVHQSESRAGA